jgi:hypothetical protein
MDQERLLQEDTLLEGDTLGLEGGILDLDILVVVGCMEEAEDTETEQNLLEDKAVDSVLVDTVLADTVLEQGVPMVHKVEAVHMEVEHWDPVDTEVPHYLDILVE